jgi:hypothetical protein
MAGVRRIPLHLLLLLLTLLIAGCGGGDDGTVGSKAKAGAVDWSLYPPGPTREFVIPGADNAVQEFGHEATKAERQQAAALISKWMHARAEQNWKKDCSYFSGGYIHSLVVTDAVKVSQGKVKNCPQALAYFGHRASGSYKNNLTGAIDSLRIGEGHGYAQYHGNDGHDWIIPVEREEGKWWVSSATPIGRSS